MAPPTCTTSPAPSTTIAGARRWPGATRSTRAATVKKASGPNGNGGLIKVAGDFRELQGTMWAHDHRFFFTAENVYKGILMMVNYYSGPDRGNEKLTDGVNLKLPSGTLLDWGNIDFDVNLVVSDAATDPDGQLFLRHLHHRRLPRRSAAASTSPMRPFMEVLPRKYRFRILNACMSRFIKLALSWNRTAVPFQFIANDGNLVVNPIDAESWTSRAPPSATTSSSTSPGSAIGDQRLSREPAEQRDGRKPDER